MRSSGDRGRGGTRADTRGGPCTLSSLVVARRRLSSPSGVVKGTAYTTRHRHCHAAPKSCFAPRLSLSPPALFKFTLIFKSSLPTHIKVKNKIGSRFKSGMCRSLARYCSVQRRVLRGRRPLMTRGMPGTRTAPAQQRVEWRRWLTTCGWQELGYERVYHDHGVEYDRVGARTGQFDRRVVAANAGSCRLQDPVPTVVPVTCVATTTTGRVERWSRKSKRAPGRTTTC